MRQGMRAAFACADRDQTDRHQQRHAAGNPDRALSIGRFSSHRVDILQKRSAAPPLRGFRDEHLSSVSFVVLNHGSYFIADNKEGGNTGGDKGILIAGDLRRVGSGRKISGTMPAPILQNFSGFGFLPSVSDDGSGYQFPGPLAHTISKSTTCSGLACGYKIFKMLGEIECNRADVPCRSPGPSEFEPSLSRRRKRNRCRPAAERGCHKAPVPSPATARRRTPNYWRPASFDRDGFCRDRRG